MEKKRTYIAIDLKSFYASVECKERNRDPLTTNLVVADKSRTEKTICLAVSPALKCYGIPGRARLFEVVQKHEYAYEMCQLQELIIKKQDERWILYLNDEVMGYVEVKKGFLIKEFCFVWDRQKIDQRRQLYE